MLKENRRGILLSSLVVIALLFSVSSSALAALKTVQNPQQQAIPYQQEKRMCEITDLTKHLQAQFPREVIDKIQKLDDLPRRYLIITLLNKSTGKTRWVVYDLGTDSALSADDKHYSPSAGLGSGEFKGEMTMTKEYAEKLFWALREENAEADAVASCTLPACSDAKILFTLDSWLNDTIIEELSPSLANNRVAFVLKEQLGTFVKSCSLDKNESDYCDRQDHQEYYKTHATGDIYPLGTLRDGILIYGDRGKDFLLTSTSDPQGGKVFALPEDTHTAALARFAPTVQQLFLVKDERNQQNQKVAALFFFDLNTGSLHKLDTFATNALHIIMIGMLQGKIYTVYRIDKEPTLPYYFKKGVDKKEEMIGAGQGWYGEAKQLQNGKALVLDIYKNKVASFECIP